MRGAVVVEADAAAVEAVVVELVSGADSPHRQLPHGQLRVRRLGQALLLEAPGPREGLQRPLQGRRAVLQRRRQGPRAALQQQLPGLQVAQLALEARKLRRVALDPGARQGKVLLPQVSVQAEQVPAPRAVAQRLDRSIISLTFPVPRQVLLPQEVQHVPAARQPIFCRVVVRRSARPRRVRIAQSLRAQQPGQPASVQRPLLRTVQA